MITKPVKKYETIVYRRRKTRFRYRGPKAAFSFIQETNSVNGTSTIVTVVITPAAGNAIVLGISWSSTTQNRTVSSVVGTDTWNNAISINEAATNPGAAIYYATNVNGVATTITVTMSGLCSFIDLYATEYSGMQNSSPVDVTNSAFGANTAATAGSVTPTVGNSLAVSLATAPSISAASNSWNLRDTADGNGWADKLNVSTTAQSTTFTTTSGIWSAVIVSFKSATGGGLLTSIPFTPGDGNPNINTKNVVSY